MTKNYVKETIQSCHSHRNCILEDTTPTLLPSREYKLNVRTSSYTDRMRYKFKLAIKQGFY